MIAVTKALTLKLRTALELLRRTSVTETLLDLLRTRRRLAARRRRTLAAIAVTVAAIMRTRVPGIGRSATSSTRPIAALAVGSSVSHALAAHYRAPPGVRTAIAKAARRRQCAKDDRHQRPPGGARPDVSRKSHPVLS